LVTLDCIPQKVKTDPFDCFYTASYAGGTTKTFMGGGIYESATADEASDNFLSSIAQDIVERWEGMVRDNAVENLEACLMLTQSSCKVPDPLIPETKREDHQPFAISSARRRAKEVSTTCGTNHA